MGTGGIVPEAVEAYIANLVRAPLERDAVLRDMERHAQGRAARPGGGRFPIVGAEVGTLLEILARMRGARRVFEVGSGFGFSAFFFGRAVGPAGEVHLTDWEAAHLDAARGFLERAKLGTTFHYHAGDAMVALVREIERAPFDVYLIDADKHRYPDYWSVIRPRLRAGDLILADNLLWDGQVADPAVTDADTAGLRRFSQLAAADPAVRFTLLPVRDGVGIVQKL